MIGDKFLVRGYDSGEYFQPREKYDPTLFLSSKKKTNYKTLEIIPLELLKKYAIDLS